MADEPKEMADGPVDAVEAGVVGGMAKELLLPTGYTYSELIAKYEDERTVYVKEIVDKESALLWVKQLSELTYVTWRKLRGYVTNGTKVIFKEAYRCQHNTDKRTRNVKSSKNTNCGAELMITIRRVGRKSCINPDDLKFFKVYPTMVTFRRSHNHSLTASSVLKYRPLSDQVIDKMVYLFKLGHSAASALHVHKMDLQIEHEEEYFSLAADGHHMPSNSIIQHLFAKVFLKEHGPYKSDLLFDHLEKYIDDYQKQILGKVSFQQTKCGTHYFAVICTPLMIRAHKTVKQSGELVLIDGCGGLDKQKHRIYSIATPTAAGGIPLGIIVTSGNYESNFQEALLVFRDMVADWGFYSRQQPQVIVTDLKEIKAVGEAFPDSKKLLCQFRLLKEMWSWLCDPNHQIDDHHRQDAFGLFRKVLCATDPATADKEFLDLICFAEENKYKIFGHHVSNMYDNKEEWVSCFRQGLPLLASSTTSYVQVIYRILKEVIFRRPSGYNILQLVDFIVRSYESYTRHRLHFFCNGKFSSALLIHILPVKFDEASYEVRNTDNEFIFKVVNTTREEEEYLVDFEAGYCSCTLGECGKLCRHLSAVILLLEKEKMSTEHHLICENTKGMYFYLAEGRPPKAENLFEVDAADQTSGDKSGQGTVEKDQQLAVPEPVVTPTFQDEKLESLWTSFGARLARCVADNPSLYRPALDKFFNNLENRGRTDDELILALETFCLLRKKPKKLENGQQILNIPAPLPQPTFFQGQLIPVALQLPVQTMGEPWVRNIVPQIPDPTVVEPPSKTFVALLPPKPTNKRKASQPGVEVQTPKSRRKGKSKSDTPSKVSTKAKAPKSKDVVDLPESSKRSESPESAPETSPTKSKVQVLDPKSEIEAQDIKLDSETVEIKPEIETLPTKPIGHPSKFIIEAQPTDFIIEETTDLAQCDKFGGGRQTPLFIVRPVYSPSKRRKLDLGAPGGTT